LVSDIPAGDRKMAKLFLQFMCTSGLNIAACRSDSATEEERGSRLPVEGQESLLLPALLKGLCHEKDLV
jgi:hypothetical protein